MSLVAIDNDVLHKTTVYGLLADLLQARMKDAAQYFMLGAARFIVARKLKKNPPSRGYEVAMAEFETLVPLIEILEPQDGELRIAAELEYAAQQADVDLDSGESMLCAALLHRGLDYLFTGDKRAIFAIQQLLDAGTIPNELEKRILCLEQLFIGLLDGGNGERIRAAICSELKADIALSNCFSCRSTGTTIDSWRQGLASYVGDLERRAPKVLASTG